MRLLLLAAALAIPVSDIGTQTPRIEQRGAEHIVRLPKAMERALESHQPGFALWKEKDFCPDILHGFAFSAKQAPFAVLGDFNSDGRSDAVLSGHDQKEQRLLAVLSAPSGYAVVDIERQPIPVWPGQRWSYGGNEFGPVCVDDYLLLVAPGKHTGLENEPLVLAGEGFERVHHEKAASIFYYRDGAFRQYATAD